MHVIPKTPKAAHFAFAKDDAIYDAAVFVHQVDDRHRALGAQLPVERDLFDCHMGCFWPAQVPDQLNHAPDWTAKCAAAQKDWRKIDLVFPG